MEEKRRNHGQVVIHALLVAAMRERTLCNYIGARFSFTSIDPIVPLETIRINGNDIYVCNWKNNRVPTTWILTGEDLWNRATFVYRSEES